MDTAEEDQEFNAERLNNTNERKLIHVVMQNTNFVAVILDGLFITVFLALSDF